MLDAGEGGVSDNRNGERTVSDLPDKARRACRAAGLGRLEIAEENGRLRFGGDVTIGPSPKRNGTWNVYGRMFNGEWSIERSGSADALAAIADAVALVARRCALAVLQAEK